MTFLSLLQQQARQLRGQIRSLLYAGQEQTSMHSIPLRQYQQLLYANLAYHRALETALNQQAAYLPGYDRLLQCRTPYIVADLLATGAPIPQEYPSYFASWSSWKLMGAAYVGEGLASEAQEVIEVLQQSPLVPPMARVSRFFSATMTTNPMATYVSARAKGHEEEVIQGVRQAIGIYSDIAHDPVA